MQSRQIFVINQMCRYLFTASIKNNISKESRIMDKLIQRSQSKGNEYNEINDFSYIKTSKKEPSSHTQRRMTVLNKIFMQHITDMMSTGEIEPALMNKGLEICNVKVTPNFKLINVYWLDNGTDTSNTKELLCKCAFELRHQLTQLHILGYMPPIQFVQYKNMYNIREIEEKMKIADYGEVHVPSSLPFTTECDSFTNKVLNSDDTFKIDLPVMTHVVFGLNHDQIMSKIKISLHKSKKYLNRQMANIQSNSHSSMKSEVQDSSNFMTADEQKKQFSKFLAERRKEQRIKRKLSKASNIIHEINMKDSHFNSNFEDSIDDDNIDDDNIDDDSIDDDSIDDDNIDDDSIEFVNDDDDNIEFVNDDDKYN